MDVSKDFRENKVQSISTERTTSSGDFDNTWQQMNVTLKQFFKNIKLRKAQKCVIIYSLLTWDYNRT